MHRVSVVLGLLGAGCGPGSALDSSLDMSQYAHTWWTVRDGFFKGNIHTMAQTPDGYVWIGTEFGLFRFDGVRSVAWQPPGGQQLPGNAVFRLLVARDCTLWIGTFNGLVSLTGSRLIPHPEIDHQFAISLLEQGVREGHWGLLGVHEHAKRIGGRLKLWSEPGAGTEAELTVPARVAYGTLNARGDCGCFVRARWKHDRRTENDFGL